MEGWTGAHNLEDERRIVSAALLDAGAEDLLARLRPMAIVREQAGAAVAGNGLWAGPRYTTHPLVREIAAQNAVSAQSQVSACRHAERLTISC